MYGGSRAADEFASAFIDWDLASGHHDAARIVTEVLSTLVDDRGQLLRLTPEAVKGVIAWVAASAPDERTEHVQELSTIFKEISHAEP